MAVAAVRMCAADECLRPAVGRQRYCMAHDQRQTRGQKLSTPIAERYESPFQRLVAAAIALADADSEDDVAFNRALDRLRKASLDHAWSRRSRKHVG